MGSRRSVNVIIHPVIGLSLIVAGAMFLWGQLFNSGHLWPLFIMIPGVALLAIVVVAGRSIAPLAIPAVVVSGTGTILLYQSLTGHWRSWAYAWMLYPVLLGGGIWLMGLLSSDRQANQTGRKLVIGGLIAFAALWLLFEAAIFSHLGIGWPLLLLTGGIVVVLRSARR